MKFKPQELSIKEVAKEQNLPVALVQEIVGFFNKKANQNYQEFKYGLEVPLIGTFYRHDSVVKSEILKTISEIRSLEKNQSVSKKEAVRKITELYKILRSLLKIRNEMAIKKVKRALRAIEYAKKIENGMVPRAKYGNIGMVKPKVDIEVNLPKNENEFDLDIL